MSSEQRYRCSWRGRKYFKILRISLVERLAYRADFFRHHLLSLPAAGHHVPALGSDLRRLRQDRTTIAGFTRDKMIAYLLLVQISRMFSSMPGLAAGIARDIRDGNLKKYLLQPIDMLWYLLSYRGAHKMAYIATTALPYGLLFFIFRDVFDGFPDTADAARLCRFAAAGVPDRLLLRGVHRHLGLLVPGNHVVHVHHQRAQFLRLRANVPARFLGELSVACQRAASCCRFSISPISRRWFFWRRSKARS